ncbi:hypothetical protein, partial [Salmonella sp. s51944]|uniref:hypothetical protein n=1 Tax=Salmonella sp. s51944 TaxID=3159655 RepID=UPI00397E9DB0
MREDVLNNIASSFGSVMLEQCKGDSLTQQICQDECKRNICSLFSSGFDTVSSLNRSEYKSTTPPLLDNIELSPTNEINISGDTTPLRNLNNTNRMEITEMEADELELKTLNI